MHRFKRHTRLLRGNKKMKKIIAIMLVFFATLGINVGANAATRNKVPNVKGDFNSVINESGVEKNSIAISIRDLNTGKPVYELNEKILMHPASVQKLLTLPPAVEVLGDDYNFSTKIYKRGNNSYIIKLGADPYLSYSDLRQLAKNIKQETTKSVYIDDSILEKKNWGEGWQWDDDMNSLMPRFNSYNLDGNVTKITVMPTQKGQIATIINPSKYPIVFLNNIKTGDKNNVKITRDNSISANTLTLEGTVNKPLVLSVPTNNLKRYFDVRLTNALSDRNIYLKQNFIIDKVITSDKELEEIKHPLSQAIDDILKNSNNMMSETVSKLAGGKAYNDKGTDAYAIKLFNDYCVKNKLDNSRLRLADASGVSKNNLVTADFISNYLVLNKNNETLQHLPTPGEGTLTHRMLPIKTDLKAKTGTLKDVSAIAGFLTTKKGNKYTFCIIINDPASTTSDMKTLEDYLIREAYIRL